MARPAKINCDYFSHFVKHDRDLDYLIERFGIEGYYFFYRLREFLCDCDNWVFKANTDRDMAYLCKQFALDKSRVEELIDICAENAIIDHDLWFELQIIWQDDLAAILKDAWKGRKTPYPEKPNVEFELKLLNFEGVSGTINPVSNPINTQRKGKDTKRKGNDNKTNDNKLKETRPNTKFIESDSKPMKKSIEEVIKKYPDKYGID